MKLLGVDPGFALTGWALCEYDGSKLTVEACGLITTQKTAKRLVADDNIMRAQRIGAQLERLLVDPKGEPYVDLVACEAMSYPPSASTAAKMSLTFGVIAEQCRVMATPFVQFSPGHIKLASAGTKKASKARMAEALGVTFPEAKGAMIGIPDSKKEHCWDAIGAAVTSLDTELVKMGVRREST